MEGLCAASFLGLALMAFAANTISLTHNEKSADSTSAAHALAQQKLEELRSKALGAVVPGNYADPLNPLKADGTTTDGSANGRFTRTWTVSADDTPSFGLRTVTVRVAWTDTFPHSTSLAAYIRCSRSPC